VLKWRVVLQVLAFARDIIPALGQLVPVAAALIKRLGALRLAGASPSYENISLSLHLRIIDAAGACAELERRQVVRFTTAETGVIRDLVWGDGDAVRAYTASGARLLGMRREGSKSALLLALPASPAAGQRAEVRCKRLIHGALTRRCEYLEVQVERPTKRLALKVSFPKHRPPTRIWMAVHPPESVPASVPVRFNASGRASAQWRRAKVRVSSTYRLSWSW
jgi:hypothetical protein